MQLFLLVILPFAVLALAATFMSLGLHQNAMRAMVAERDLRAVETTAHFLESKVQAEQEIANVLVVQSGTELLNVFIREHAYETRNLALLSPQGKLLAFHGTEDARQILGQVTISSGEIQTVTAGGGSVLIFSAQSDTGKLAANIVYLQPLLREVIGNDFAESVDAAAFLISKNHVVLARIGSMEMENDANNHPGVNEALNGHSGFTYMSTAGMEHVVAYSPVSQPDWALIFEEPWEMVDTPYLRLTQFAPLILIPLLAFTLVAIWFGVTQVVIPLQKLETLAAQLAWGDFTAIEKSVEGVQEIRQLQNELIHMAQKVQDSQRSLHDYIGAITRGQEDERRRLARELHDDTLQSLIALHQRVQLAQMKAGDEKMQTALTELESLSSSSIDELRRFTRALRPIYLEDLGLVTALEMLARENSTSGLVVSFVCAGVEQRLDVALELTLFRIAQEALSNINHHARASEAHVLLKFQTTKIILEISDNGQGFVPPRSPAEFAPAGHYGLLGMHERVELVGGKLSIESAPGKGALLRVELSSLELKVNSLFD